MRCCRPEKCALSTIINFHRFIAQRNASCLLLRSSITSSFHSPTKRVMSTALRVSLHHFIAQRNASCLLPRVSLHHVLLLRVSLHHFLLLRVSLHLSITQRNASCLLPRVSFHHFIAGRPGNFTAFRNSAKFSRVRGLSSK